MSNCDKIYAILKNPDKETKEIEFKQSAILNLNTNDDKRNFIKEIVAFANRIGGKFLIGINNDGNFEGWHISNSDKIKENVNNIILSHISPKIVCDIEYYNCKEGDVILIDIPQKEDIPFARVIRKNNHIKYREYFIRTSHGTSLVSDNQLKFLFKQQDLNSSTSFRVSIIFETPGYNLPSLFSIPQLPGIRPYLDRFLIENLPPDFMNKLEQNKLNFHDLIIDSLSIFLSYSILCHFSGSWDVDFTNFGGSRHFNFHNQKAPEEKIKFEDILKQSQFKTLTALSVSTEDILNILFLKEFHLPPKTKVELIKGRAFIKFYNDVYKVEIKNIGSSSGIGFDQSHPYYGRYMERNSEDRIRIQEKYHFMKMDFILKVELKFPLEDIDYYDLYPRFLDNIKKIIDFDWNFEKFVTSLPDPMIFTLDDKLNEILRLLK